MRIHGTLDARPVDEEIIRRNVEPRLRLQPLLLLLVVVMVAVEMAAVVAVATM